MNIVLNMKTSDQISSEANIIVKQKYYVQLNKTYIA